MAVRKTFGRRSELHVLHQRAGETWEHAERMQARGYPYSEVSNVTTLRFAIPAKPTTPLARDTPPPLIELPRVPRVEIQSADFWWQCDLPGCPRGWHGERDGTFWPPKYVKIFADDGVTLADLRYGCCEQHARILKDKAVKERMLRDR